MFNGYEALGFSLILVVGEDGTKQAATTTYAAMYKESYNFPDGVVSVADPHWLEFRNTFTHGSNVIALPHFVVLDGLMEIVYIGPELSVAQEFVVQLLGIEE